MPRPWRHRADEERRHGQYRSQWRAPESPQGSDDHAGHGSGEHLHSALLLSRQADHRGQLPHVPGRGGGGGPCATPVTEGMKVFTKSPKAVAAQRATMEFLLINHPLDCPICDQGGECELQDLAVGLGRDISRFVERKRSVKDKNLGPLVSTDMTRCIPCTRCVRFGQDIAGIQEIGATGRGENMEIGTFIEHSVDHELSGNIIDLCPVGALNSKPFRYRGRGWEMTQFPLISPHDGVGTQLYGHVLRGRLMRVVPRPCEEINETWIADRDRFSYEGVYSEDRLLSPPLRQADGSWRDVEWDVGLSAAAQGLKAAAGEPGGVGLLAHPSSTLEELYLLARLAQ